MLVKIFNLLLASSVAFGQANIITPDNVRSLKQFKNYVINPDAEKNITSGITNASSIVTRDTSSARLNGNASFEINATSSGQTVKFRLNTLPGKFDLGNGEFSFIYNGTFTTATGEYKAYIENNSGTKKSPEYSLLSTDGRPTVLTGYFVGDDTLDNPYYLVIESTVANSAAMDVDDVYAGDITSIGQFSAISDVVNAGAMTITATTTNPTKATTRQTDSVTYVREGKYAYITYRYVADPATGSAAGSGTYLWSLPSGLSMDTSVQANSGGSAVGSQSSVANATIPGDAVFYSTTGPSGAFAYTITAYSATQFYVYYQQLGSTGNGTVGSGAFPLTQVIGFRITIKVPIQGWSASQSAAAASQTDYGFTSFTPVSPQGLGTVTVASANDCGHWRSAEYLNVSCKLTIGTVGSSTARLTLPNSLTISSTKVPNIRIAGHWWRSSATSNAVKRGSVLATGGNTYVEFSIDHYANAVNPLVAQLGNAILASSDLLSIEFQVPISGWEPNQRAPTLIGSVTSNGVSAESVVRIRYYTTAYGTVCSASSCTVESNISGVSIARTSTSIYTITFPAGTFSAAPVCQIHPKNATNVMGASDFSLSVPSATSYAFGTYITTTGAAGQTYGEILCIGPR